VTLTHHFGDNFDKSDTNWLQCPAYVLWTDVLV